MSERFSHLFAPITIRGVTLRNRVCITAHFAGWWADPEGLPTDAFRAYVEDRAKGGAGLFIIGATATRADGSPPGHPSWFLNVADDIIERYRLIVQGAHRHGCAVFAQLIHCGDPFSTLVRPPGFEPAIPRSSSVPPARSPTSHSRSVDDIADVVASFGRAAVRAVAGGVDGLELHAHEQFLHAQFLSPHWNSRTDSYGGDLAGRSRLVVETLRAMRDAVGQDVPIGIRLKADDGVDGGMSPSDYGRLVTDLEHRKLVDFVSFTSGDQSRHHAPMYRPPGEGLVAVAQIRALTGTRLAVMYAGGITDPHRADAAIAAGTTDLVGLTKAHIADPDFTRKARAGRLGEIRYCMRCLQSCIGSAERMTCVYNPVTSRELAWGQLRHSPHRRKIVVIGAGPAGMESALTAARRGHTTVVLERGNRIGGQVRLACSSPLRRNFGEIAGYYERQASNGLLDVRLGIEADVRHVLGERPDAVIVATGSTPRPLVIPRQGDFVPCLTLDVREALDAHLPPGSPPRAVIVDREGRMEAFVAADLLSDRGFEVDFLTPFPEPGPHLDRLNQGELCARLASRSVRFRPGWDVRWWTGRSTISAADVTTGEDDLLDGVQLVVAANGSEPLNQLAMQIRAAAPRLDIHVIGDANAIGTVEQATYQGARVGRLV